MDQNTQGNSTSSEIVQNRRSCDKFGSSYSIIDEGVSFQGDITVRNIGNSNIKIFGVFKGNIDSQGVVFVKKTGDFNGTIKAACIVIEGKSTGNHHAFEKIELKSEAVVEGDLETPSLNMADGCDFNGDIKTGILGFSKLNFVKKRSKKMNKPQKTV